MNIKTEITTRLKRINSTNVKRTNAFRDRLKKQIHVNIVDLKQSVHSNQVLIDRFYSAKPQALTQMQVALKEAAL